MKGTLVARATPDGLFRVNDDVPLGRTYEVVPGSARTATFFNTEHHVLHAKEVVSIRDSLGHVTYFPTALLRIEDS